MVLGDPRYARACRAITTHGPAVALQTVDVVRDSDGISSRSATTSTLRPASATPSSTVSSRRAPCPKPRPSWRRWLRPNGGSSLRESLAALAAPDRISPRVVVLVAGVDAVEYFEYAYLATTLGYHVVQGDDLVVRSGRLLAAIVRATRPVDVVLRACRRSSAIHSSCRSKIRRRRARSRDGRARRWRRACRRGRFGHWRPRRSRRV